MKLGRVRIDALPTEGFSIEISYHPQKCLGCEVTPDGINYFSTGILSPAGQLAFENLRAIAIAIYKANYGY